MRFAVATSALLIITNALAEDDAGSMSDTDTTSSISSSVHQDLSSFLHYQPKGTVITAKSKAQHILHFAHGGSNDYYQVQQRRKWQPRVLVSQDAASINTLPNKHRILNQESMFVTTKSHKEEDMVAVECKPNNADVGILSCAIGQYCQESQNSSQGGFCVPQNNQHLVEEAIMMEQTKKSGSINVPFGRRRKQRQRRRVQEDETPFLQLLEELCSTDENTLTCDKCDISAVDYTAEFDCSYPTDCYTLGSLCNSTQILFCENHTLEGTLNGQDEFEFKACYTLTTPKTFSYCITYAYSADPNEDATCEIEIEGVKCNSCTLLFQAAVTGDWCREFDCENTRLGKSASICDYSILEAFTTDYMYNQLPCEDGCNLCGENGTMIDAALKQFTIPRIATLNCFQTQLEAMRGTYNRQQCLELEALVDEPCSCEKSTPVEAPEPSAPSASSMAVVRLATVTAIATCLAVISWM